MDSAAVAMPQPSLFLRSSESRIFSNFVTVGRGRPAMGILSSEFCDQGHLRYYSTRNRNRGSPSLSAAAVAVINGKEDTKKMKKKKKQQLKLLKGLSRDLSSFSQMGFGLDSEALVDQLNLGMMSEAADVLLERLQKLRAEEKELKRKQKEEKARLKASQMQTRSVDCQESSSSSSESSDSDCNEVVDIKSFKQEQVLEDQPNGLKQLTLDKENSLPPPPIAPAINLPAQFHTSEAMDLAVDPANKIEVCMGGKCKKSGAVSLMEEFKKAVGMEVAVCECKCMGKCKEGPNVKVLNSMQGALCKGVGMEDVDMIVSKFLDPNQNNNQMGFAAAS